MPNEMKYVNVNCQDDSEITGERLATNGEYTGMHKGAPLTDQTEGADNAPYLRARETVRFGTLTPDAGDKDFPDIAVSVAYAATGTISDISLSGVTYADGKFDSVPSKTKSFTFKDAGTAKTATNTDGTWSIA